MEQPYLKDVAELIATMKPIYLPQVLTYTWLADADTCTHHTPHTHHTHTRIHTHTHTYTQ